MEIGDDVLKFELSTLAINKADKLAFMKAVEKKHGKSWGNTIFETKRALDNHIKLMETELNGGKH